MIYWHIPGFAAFGASEYDAVTAYDVPVALCPSAQPLIEISLVSGPGEAYDEIRIVQVLASEVVDNTSGIVLDMTSYDAVIEHFGDEVTLLRH